VTEVAPRQRCADLLRMQQLVALLARHALPSVAGRCLQQTLAALEAACRDAESLLAPVAAAPPPAADAADELSAAGQWGGGSPTQRARLGELPADLASVPLDSWGTCLPALLVHCSSLLAFSQAATCSSSACAQAAASAAACCQRLQRGCPHAALSAPTPVHFGTEASIHAAAAAAAATSSASTLTVDRMRPLRGEDMRGQEAAGRASIPPAGHRQSTAAAAVLSKQTLGQVLAMAADVARAAEAVLSALPPEPPAAGGVAPGGAGGGADCGGGDCGGGGPAVFPVPRPDPKRSREGVDFSDDVQFLRRGAASAHPSSDCIPQ